MAMAIAASFLVLLLAAAPTVYGANHAVGGNSGWALSVDYSNWAAGETFTVGDNLVFNYESTHKVAVVNANDYSSCSSSNALNTYEGGSSTVPLNSTGKMYFICPTPNHCDSGMKLEINVVATSNSPSGTPSTPAASSPPSNATTSPPPPSNGAFGGFGTLSHLMGSSFVSVIILVCMS